MRKRYITAILTLLVVLMHPQENGIRKIAKLAGKEITVMKHLKATKEVRPTAVST